MTDELTVTNYEMTESPITSLTSLDDFYEVVDFRDIFNHKQSAADRLLDVVADVATGSATGETIKKGLKKEVKYVVQMSDDLKKAVDLGTVKLDYSKTGEIYAQIKNGSRYGAKLPITKEIVAAGINPMEISQALQMKALEHKLDDMLDVLDEIGQDVAEVIQGQQNDRIALYNSGLNLYLESRNVQDATFKSLVAAQALKTLSDGSEQIQQELRSSIQYLLEGKYKKNKGKSSEEIQERMQSINKCFDIVHKSYLLKAAVYYDRGEIPAMLSSLDEYGKFLKRDIIPNAPKLTEFDKSDVLLQNGKWDKRAKLFDSIGEVRKQIAGTSTYYLDVGEEKNDG